jgi:flagellar FliL protein
MAANPEEKKPAPAPEKGTAIQAKGGAAPEKGDSTVEKPPPASPGSNLIGWVVAAAAIVLAPAASWAVVQYVLLPGLEKKLEEPPTTATASAADAAGADADAKAKAAPPTYEFTNVVVNLAGTMGTRYLKTSFVVTGPDAGLPAVFEANKAKLMDVTLNVLSSLTLSDLEEPGSKNVLREKLVSSYNDTLGHRVVDQVYFSDFVVQ